MDCRQSRLFPVQDDSRGIIGTQLYSFCSELSDTGCINKSGFIVVFNDMDCISFLCLIQFYRRSVI